MECRVWVIGPDTKFTQHRVLASQVVLGSTHTRKAAWSFGEPALLIPSVDNAHQMLATKISISTALEPGLTLMLFTSAIVPKLGVVSASASIRSFALPSM